jgi:hypothetical protein
MAQVHAVQPHVAVLVHAIKVNPHNRAGARRIDGEVPPVPRHVEGQKSMLHVVLGRVFSLDHEIVRCVDGPPVVVGEDRRAGQRGVGAAGWRCRWSRRCGTRHRGPVGGPLFTGARIVAVPAAPARARGHARLLTPLPESAVGVPAARGLAELLRRHEDHGATRAEGSRHVRREVRRVAERVVVAGVAELETPVRIEGRCLAR